MGPAKAGVGAAGAVTGCKSTHLGMSKVMVVLTCSSLLFPLFSLFLSQ